MLNAARQLDAAGRHHRLLLRRPFHLRHAALSQPAGGGDPGRARALLGVSAITYRQRGTFAGFIDLPEVVAPAPRQILRVDNDPSWPERGTIRVIVEGGR